MQPVYVRLTGNLRRFNLSREGQSQPFDRLALSGRNHRLVNCMLGGQFRQRLIAPDRLQSNLRLEISPLALACHFTHKIPSLDQAGIA